MPSKETMERLDQTTKAFEELEKQGVKMRVYWTLGRYDGVTIIEAPSEKRSHESSFSFSGCS